MIYISLFTSMLLGAGANLASAAPLEKRSCTFTTYAAANSGASSCSAVVLDGIAVPAGETLDLSSLKEGASVLWYSF